jgi:NAD(P)-dependent dehydrogenase (short-subunit alcohol dehydrogenase family)
MCDALNEQGCAIAIMDRNISDSTRANITSRYGPRTVILDLDLEDEAATNTAIPQVLDAFGRLDILINNAAFVGSNNLKGWSTGFSEQTVGTWRRAIEVNLTAAFALCQSAAPHLAKSKHGSIINLASIYGVTGPDWRLYEGTEMGNPAAYAVSKGGLIQLTKWLSTTLAPDVRVNAISPGGVIRNQPQKFQDRYQEKTPLGRMAIEEDFKGIVALLASDASAYITGQNIIVDGGWSVW